MNIQNSFFHIVLVTVLIGISGTFFRLPGQWWVSSGVAGSATKILYTRLKSDFERNERNLARLHQSIDRLGILFDRLGVYATHATNKENKTIALFTQEMQKKLAICNRSIVRLEDRVDRIKEVIDKSNPDIGLDPQMEPMVTSFVSSVEDINNEITNALSRVKEFETTLQTDANIQFLLSSTDSIITRRAPIKNEASADTRDVKVLTRVQELQKEAYSAYKKGNTKQAVKLTNEAYYLLIDITPAELSAVPFEEQYSGLINQLIAAEKLVQNSDNKKVSTMYHIAEKRVIEANSYKKEGEIAAAQKELTTSGYLITKIMQILAAEEEHDAH